jgi:PAS domain-containing protein
MICNEPLAKLFGCTVQEWCDTEDFLGTFVDTKDREMFAQNYAKSIGHLQGPVRFRFKAVRKDGKTFNAETDMIPITFGGHAVAYHFVREVKS